MRALSKAMISRDFRFVQPGETCGDLSLEEKKVGGGGKFLLDLQKFQSLTGIFSHTGLQRGICPEE